MPCPSSFQSRNSLLPNLKEGPANILVFGVMAFLSRRGRGRYEFKGGGRRVGALYGFIVQDLKRVFDYRLPLFRADPPRLRRWNRSPERLPWRAPSAPRVQGHDSAGFVLHALVCRHLRPYVYRKADVLSGEGGVISMTLMDLPWASTSIRLPPSAPLSSFSKTDSRPYLPITSPRP